jgi:hypothetical protein
MKCKNCGAVNELRSDKTAQVCVKCGQPIQAGQDGANADTDFDSILRSLGGTLGEESDEESDKHPKPTPPRK